MFVRIVSSVALACGCSLSLSNQVIAQVVPGTGTKYTSYGDDFESDNWKFIHNFPKSSREQDDNVRSPRGYSSNNRWLESAKRGQPDEIWQVPTPPGGLSGSKFSMAMRTVNTGVPGRPSYEQQQDDLVMNGRALPVSWSPNCVVRVYLPPFEEWENRSGATLGIRADCKTTITEQESVGGGKRRLFRNFSRLVNRQKTEKYWPGFFIMFNSETSPQYKEDSAQILIRGNYLGHEIPGPKITQTGWWTFGMSFTPDGRVHYYASPGVDPLKPSDLITSQNPYGYSCESFSTMFFNVVSPDNGRTQSTTWIIDDPAIYHHGQRDFAGSGTTRR